VADLARRMPYLASIYGRMVPVEAAWQLDRYIDQASLPVRWVPGDPVAEMSAARLAPVADGAPAVQMRIAIHDLHAMGYLMIADDGAVTSLVPARPDLGGTGTYAPARYRLAWAPHPAPPAQMLNKHGTRARYGRGHPVTGIIWSQPEFLDLPWVRDYLPAGGAPGSKQDPRGQITSRYGEKIPADLAVIDMAADDVTVVAVANASRGYLEPAHLLAFAGVGDIRQALHELHAQELLLPLSNGLVLAPGLILEPLAAN
jgi:hypothetical protein